MTTLSKTKEMSPDARQQSNWAYQSVWRNTLRERSKKRIDSTSDVPRSVYKRIDKEEERRRALFRMLPDEVIERIIERYRK